MMVFKVLFVTSLSSWLLALAAAAAFVDTAASKHNLKINFQVRRGSDKSLLSPTEDSEPKLVKRDKNDHDSDETDVEDGSLEIELINEKTFYFADLLVGSNKEKNQVLIDTGSSDLWVMSNEVDCNIYGTYSRKRDAKNVFDSLLFGKESSGDEDMTKERNIENKDWFKRDMNPDSIITGLSESTQLSTLDSGERDRLDSSSASSSSSYDHARKCTSYGSFNTGESDTFVQNDTTPFNVTYADGSYARGVYGHDTVEIEGGVTIPDVSFAIVNKSSSEIGVLGIGLPGLESTNINNGGKRYMYENLPMKMKSEGIINKTIYSLYLDQSNAKSGTILFGAVDHAKYLGTLETLPLVRIDSKYNYPLKFDVIVEKIDVNNDGDKVSALTSKETAVLDSGSTLSYLRSSQIEEIAQALGAKYISGLGAYRIDCDYLKSDATLDISFGSKIIKVPVSELIMKTYSGKQCHLGIFRVALDFPYIILGDNVLRSAYVVYDVENYKVHIGQVYYTNDEDIEVVEGDVPTSGGQTSTRVWTGSGRAGSGTSLEDYGNLGVRDGISTQNKLLFLWFVIFSWVL